MRSVDKCKTSFLAHVCEQILQLVFSHWHVTIPDLVRHRMNSHCGYWLLPQGMHHGSLFAKYFSRQVTDNGIFWPCHHHRLSLVFVVVDTTRMIFRCPFTLDEVLQPTSFVLAVSHPVSSGSAFAASLAKVKNCIKPCCIYQTLKTIQAELVGGVKIFQVLTQNWALVLSWQNQRLLREIFQWSIKKFVCRFECLISNNRKR